MKNKKIEKIHSPFPLHKVTLKSIIKWSDLGKFEYYDYPSKALKYLCEQFDGQIVVVKHKVKSIIILVYCEDIVYESLKLDFIRNMGNSFIWKD